MPRKAQPGKTRRKVESKQWHARALQLRVDGLSYREVAKRVNKSVAAVHAAVEEELAAIPAAGVERLREVRGEQLEAVIKGNLAKAKRGATGNSLVVIKAIAEYAKLFGLNAKVEVDLSASLTLGADAHAQLLDRLSRLAPSDEEDGGGEEPQPG